MDVPVSDLIRGYFKAYVDKDRGSLERLLSGDFTFTSPVDDHISRSRYLERCWPNCEDISSYKIDTILEQGDGAFVSYRGTRKSGEVFKNTEFFQTDRHQVKEVDVYFGANVAVDADENEILGIVEKTVKACRLKNAGAFLEDYDREIVTFDLLKPQQHTGKKALLKKIQTWFDSFAGQIEYRMIGPKVSAGTKVAFCHSLNHVQGMTIQGERVNMWWRATLGFKKNTEGWKVIQSHGLIPLDLNHDNTLLNIQP